MLKLCTGARDPRLGRVRRDLAIDRAARTGCVTLFG
jgi:hypothetical protein